MKAEALMAAGKYGDVIAMRRTLKPKENAAHADLLSRAYVMKGNALMEEELPKRGALSGPLFKQAGENYAAALKIKPDHHEALNNWGRALKFQAFTKKEAAADRLFKKAYEKHAAALKIKPDYHDALRYWGEALSDQAHYFKTGAAADRLFKQAYEKFSAALKIKPDDDETLYIWGRALSDHVRSYSRRHPLSAQARRKMPATTGAIPFRIRRTRRPGLWPTGCSSRPERNLLRH